MLLYVFVFKIQNYLNSSSNKPLIIYGESGCGKTSLIAYSAQKVCILIKCLRFNS